VTHDFENRTDRRAGVINFSNAVFEPEMEGIARWFAEHPPGTPHVAPAPRSELPLMR
jgi:hypothetical protein